MTSTEVQEYHGLRVGQQVILREESGFHAGKPQRKTIKRIVVVKWEWEEASKLNVPMEEFVVRFTDGSTGGTYDRITPAPTAPERGSDEDER